jgi:DNA-binding transcriptional regulator YiaG
MHLKAPFHTLGHAEPHGSLGNNKERFVLAPEEIRTLREYTEMTQIQMAQLLRVRPADVIAWENGTLEPTTEQMELLERLRMSGVKKLRFKFN